MRTNRLCGCNAVRNLAYEKKLCIIYRTRISEIARTVRDSSIVSDFFVYFGMFFADLTMIKGNWVYLYAVLLLRKGEENGKTNEQKIHAKNRIRGSAD